jgi:hypothetical protein
MPNPSGRAIVLLGCAGLLMGGSWVQTQTPAAGGAPAVTAAPAVAVLRPTLDRYCVTCHSDRLRTAGLSLQSLDDTRVADHPDVWEKVARKLRTREMPPVAASRPDERTYAASVASLEAALDSAAAAHPAPGRVAVHRLNRTEYANAIRDLLGLEIAPPALLPADEPDQQTFDNVASVLSVSPALLENYLSAAYRVSRLAVATPDAGRVIETYQVPMALVQDDRVDDNLPFGTQGGAAFRHRFAVAGEYSITVTLRRQLYLYIIGMGEPHDLDVRIDGVRVGRFSIGGEGKGATGPESFSGNTQGDPQWEVYMHTADKDLRVRVPVSAGDHEVSVAFVRRYWEPEGILQPPQRGFARTTNELYHGHPAVDHVEIAGPLAAVAPSTAQADRSPLFVCRPKGRADETACARQIFTNLATRAYRRPVAPAEIDTVMIFFAAGRTEGDFDAGVQRGVERILASPSFLFRVIHEPAGFAPGTPFQLSDGDLASRLSFFLWSSVPDDELAAEARRGRLHEPAVLDRQIRRMLRDVRSQALVDNFAFQWLKIGKVAGVVPDVDAFPDFDENLRRAMLEETRQFIGDQLRGDRSVVDLVTADYTFLNERLAKHYGIAGVYGSHFRKVPFSDGTRGGVLGQASVLTATSYPNRTSPVLRGKWVLDALLGSPPPPPPPDVPTLEQSARKDRPTTQREQMEAHRRSPTCASCHVRMDPLGFSLEQYDALGKFRTSSEAGPIDATASLPDGSRFEGVAGLRAFLGGHREDFVRTFTEKLLAYGLGRGLEATDQPTVRQIVRAAAPGDYRWSAIVSGIAQSTPFSMATAAGPQARNHVERASR